MTNAAAKEHTVQSAHAKSQSGMQRGRLTCLSLCLSLAAVGCTASIDSSGDAGAGATDNAGGSPNQGSGATTGAGAAGGSGAVGPGGGAAGTVAVDPTTGRFDKPTSVLVPSSRLSRLSRLQWTNSVRDLLKLTDLGGVESSLSKDAIVNFDNDGDTLFITEDMRQDFEAIAEKLANKVARDPAALARLLPANAPTSGAEKAKAFIDGFGLRAYRRPLTEAESAEALKLFNSSSTLFPGVDSFVGGAELVIDFFLQSPNFLYRAELSTQAADGKVKLSPFEVASKLAFSLTSSMPDDELLGAAKGGTFGSTDSIQASAKRLLDSDRGLANVENFNFQMMKLGSYAGLLKNRTMFPAWTDKTPAALERGTTLFLDFIFKQNLGIKEMFTKPVGFVNSALAPFYGLKGNFTDAYQQVDLDPTQRAGLVTQAGFLAQNSHESEIDSIRRGVFTNQRVICFQLPPPAMNITAVPPSDGTSTNRQRVTMHTGPGTCGATCHGQWINPAGFAFENYDAVGAYRTTDNGFPIDASGEYPFTDKKGVISPKKYNGPIEFSKVLSESPQVHECFSQNWMSYVYGRTVEPAGKDAPMVKYLAQESLESGLSIRDVILTLTATDEFTSRLP